MRVLIACEFSGIVRDAFIAMGHDAISCDLEDTESEGPHIKDDVIKVLKNGWDLMIAHPPCTYLAVSGARWFKYRQIEQRQALEFVRVLMSAPIEKIAIENPISVISSKIRRPDQIIEPYMFGHPETKATCLWLKNLPKLVGTKYAPEPHFSRIHSMSPGVNRSKDRSRTYKGIAEAMAEQWG